jgi:hypothetical protein
MFGGLRICVCRNSIPHGGTLKALATTLFDRFDYLAHWLTKNPDPDKELGQGSHA